MKYISEETIIELITELTRLKHPDMGDIAMHLRDHSIDTLKMVISECRELNPWQPIESAPKDRKIMIFSDEYGWEFGRYNEKSARWSCHTRKPKAWMEIPEPPK